jgi:hypothetical protein
MSSPGFAASLRVTPRPSAILALSLGAAHLLALTSVFAVSLPLALKLALGAAVLASLCHAVYVHVLLQGRRSIRELIWTSSGALLVKDAHGRDWDAHVCANSFVHPRLLVLRLSLDKGSPRAMVLLPDSVTADVLRQLRVRLRLTSGASADS